MSELGGVLKEAREKQNISLDELQHITKIQKRYLEGIEQGNYKILPGSFYVRAFIRQYAEAVGLSPEELFEQYDTAIPGTAIKNEQIQPIKRTRKRQRKDEMYHRYHKVYDIGPKIILGLLIIGLFLGIWYVFQFGTKDEGTKDKTPNEPGVEYKVNEKFKEEEKPEVPKSEDDTNKGTEQVKEEEVAPLFELVSTTDKTRSTYKVSNTSEFILTVDSIGVSYIDIKNSIGKVFFSGMTKEDETLEYDFTREKEVTINIGRTSDIELKVNGEPFTLPSDKTHQYITFKFTPDNE